MTISFSWLLNANATRKYHGERILADPLEVGMLKTVYLALTLTFGWVNPGKVIIPPRKIKVGSYLGDKLAHGTFHLALQT